MEFRVNYGLSPGGNIIQQLFIKPESHSLCINNQRFVKEMSESNVYLDDYIHH